MYRPDINVGIGTGWSVIFKYLKFMELKTQKIKNTPQLKDNRRKLRRCSTSAEAELWMLLKGKKLEGRKFRRQYSISKYIIDFYCVSEKLAVELDGDLHGDYGIQQRDQEREKYLENLGVRVIRFENRLVFQESEMVLDAIRSQFKIM